MGGTTAAVGHVLGQANACAVAVVVQPANPGTFYDSDGSVPDGGANGDDNSGGARQRGGTGHAPARARESVTRGRTRKAHVHTYSVSGSSAEQFRFCFDASD
ncbi:hypothetical protein ACQEVF_57955 [Nonomuraea polychroma]|uniref:hypothetical protein n=1 Tax=Nonomuraea polychroma TaxID=46176 RepID=UPI003D91E217